MTYELPDYPLWTVRLVEKSVIFGLLYTSTMNKWVKYLKVITISLWVPYKLKYFPAKYSKTNNS